MMLRALIRILRLRTPGSEKEDPENASESMMTTKEHGEVEEWIAPPGVHSRDA